MRAMLRRILVCIVFALMAQHGAFAQSFSVLNYQGRVTVNGTNFNGSAYFVFSIHDTNGVILWSSGTFPMVGSTNLPAGVWKLALRDGVYNIRLGDRGAGMPALDANLLRTAAAPFLRVWINDGATSWRQLADDVPLKTALAPTTSPGVAAVAGGNTLLTAAQGEAILHELRDLRSQLQKPVAAAPTPQAAPAPPQTATVTVNGSPTLGRDDAPVVLVEFTDYQCPFCKRAQDDAISGLKKKYVEAGKLRLVSRNLPLEFHANAEPAALATLCAMQQKQFWPMRDKLFAINTTLTPENFLKAATELNLDTNIFLTCIREKTFAAQINRDKQDAAAAGITGTPTFVLGRANGEKVSGTLIIGARPLAFFEAEIEKLLATK